MKKKILMLGLIISMFSPKLLLAVETIQLNEGDKVHLCIKGEVDAQLERRDGTHTTLTQVGIDAYTEGKSFGLFPAKANKTIGFSNDGDVVHVKDALFFAILSTAKYIMFFDTDGDQVPYVEYIPAGSSQKACVKGTPIESGYSFKISEQFMALYVTEITDPVPEEAPTPEEVVPAADPALPNNNAAPQSGGCSMTTALSGFNYSFSMLFALILGAHALLRFRKK